MIGVPATRFDRPGAARRRADARELARTPVVDPYRSQLADPYYAASVPGEPAETEARDELAALPPAGSRGAGQGRGIPGALPAAPPRAGRRTPPLAVAIGVAGIVLGVAVGVLGLLVIALVNLIHGLDAGDRSFYSGRDASYVLLGVLDLGVSVLLVGGSIAFLTGKLTGRIAMTVGTWTTIGFSVFWWREDRIPAFIPLVTGLLALAVLVLSYQASITRWLGVRPPPQPE